MNQLIFEEKKERLQKMKPENSLNEYNNLCEIYTIIGKSNLGKLEERKINCLIKIRKIFDTISKAKKKNEFTIISDFRGSKIFHKRKNPLCFNWWNCTSTLGRTKIYKRC